jgi:hypothetical protein
MYTLDFPVEIRCVLPVPDPAKRRTTPIAAGESRPKEESSAE